MARSKRKKRPVTLANVPGYDGTYQEGTRDVPDPLEPGASIRAVVNVKATILDHMASRDRIDTAQKAAGEKFYALFRSAAIGRQKAIDYSQPGVDGGTVGDPLTDSVVHATKELNDAIRATGLTGSRMLLAILGEGKGIADVARAWSDAGGVVSGDRAEGYVTGTFTDALDTLVDHWGMKAVGRPKRRTEYIQGPNGRIVKLDETIRSTGPITLTGPTYEIVANRFGDLSSREVRPERRSVDIHASGNTGGRKMA